VVQHLAEQHVIADDEISLKSIFDTLWGGRWLIVIVTVAAVIVAAALAFLLPKKYEATVVLSAVVTNPGEGQLSPLSSLASQFGGLASLAGIPLTADTKKAESLATLESEVLTRKYLADNHLLQVLYARKWDASRSAWTETDPEKVPTLWKASRYFTKKIRSVRTESKTGLVTMTISWRDAPTAAKWANELVQLTNSYLRGKAIEQSERNIAYLNSEATRTNVVEARQAIYAILQNEINKAMLARGSSEYAFKVLDPATVPEEPAFPKPLIFVLVGAIAGVFLSALTIFLRAALK
jgi:capsular polysaccharide biosynthesis protein